MTSRRDLPEVSLTDPLFWGTALVIFGIMSLVGQFVTTLTVSFWGVIMFSIGVVSLFVRHYRRGVQRSERRNREE